MKGEAHEAAELCYEFGPFRLDTCGRELLEGNRVGGVAVEVGRGVSGLAGKGEVLVSHTVRDLVAGSGLSFEERGKATFDASPGAWRLYKVRMDGGGSREA